VFYIREFVKATLANVWDLCDDADHLFVCSVVSLSHATLEIC